MKAIPITLIGGLILLYMGACSSMRMITSQPSDQKHDFESYQYDSDNQLMYMVFNDDDTLHLKLKTSNRSTMGKMLRLGTKVYFDLSGKKKKNLYVQYPLGGSKQGPRYGGTESSFGKQSRPDPDMQFQQIRPDLLFVKNNEEELIQPSDILPSDIKCRAIMEEDTELVYELKIPFYRLADGGLGAISTLTIGVETETM